MKQKTVDCLNLSKLSLGTQQRRELLETIIKTHSDKVVKRKLQELKTRGYITFSDDIYMSEITEKGLEFLNTCQEENGTLTRI